MLGRAGDHTVSLVGVLREELVVIGRDWTKKVSNITPPARQA
jgi:hypothetical protein